MILRKNTNKTLVIGNGETGQALFEIFKKHYPTDIKDKEELKGRYDILHICFPYSDKFVSEVKRYQKLYKPKYTIIHSTIPVGTSRKCDAIHSPIIGLHPFLKKSILTFTKYLSGERVGEVADYFRKTGIKVYITDKPETTELMKIMDTTQYGLEIEFVKEIKRLCDKYKLPFEFWSLYVNNYNEGYEKIGYSGYKKSNLIPIMQPIGGHCIKQNAKLFKNKFTNLIK